MTRTEAIAELQSLDSQWKTLAAEHDKAAAPAIAKVRTAANKLAEAKRDLAGLLRAREIDQRRYERERQSLLHKLETELADPRIAETVGRIDTTLRKLQQESVPAHAPDLLARVDRLLSARPRLLSYRTSEPADLDEEIGKVLADCR